MRGTSRVRSAKYACGSALTVKRFPDRLCVRRAEYRCGKHREIPPKHAFEFHSVRPRFARSLACSFEQYATDRRDVEFDVSLRLP